jgi:hypothetical protein
MPLFAKPYKSEITQFLEELKAKKPQLEEAQRQGRALLWDRPLDSEFLDEARRARVPQKPYVYGSES